jgi:7-cyano-7-deazaguanine synthase
LRLKILGVERMNAESKKMGYARNEERMTRPSTKATVLLSGGIDSAALLGFYLCHDFNVSAFFVDFGQPAARQELNAAKSLCEYHKVPLFVFTAKGDIIFSAGEVVGRNAFLLFTAMLVCQGRPGIIAMGIHEGTPYYDCSEGFLNAVQVIVDGYTAGSIKIAAPFLKWNKLMIWEFCKQYDLPIQLTYSCEKGGPRPCGSCLSCKDREALSAL